MNNIELRQLRCFVAVAEMMSFGKAAKSLHISQPPLSRLIGRLEQSLGLTLLNRSYEGVSLRPAGTIFLAEAKQILQRVEHAGILAKRAECGEVGDLNVGCSFCLDSALNQFLRTKVEQLADVRLCLHPFPSPNQVSLLRNHSLDAGIVRLPLQDVDHLTLELLCWEPILAMVATTHPLAERTEISLCELEHLEVIIPPRDSFPLVHNQIYRMCMQANLNVAFLDPPEHLETLTRSVDAGKVLALVPAAVRYALTPLKAVRLIPIHEHYASLGVGVLYRRDYVSPALDRFLTVVRQFPIDFSVGKLSNGIQSSPLPPDNAGDFASRSTKPSAAFLPPRRARQPEFGAARLRPKCCANNERGEVCPNDAL